MRDVRALGTAVVMALLAVSCGTVGGRETLTTGSGAKPAGRVDEAKIVVKPVVVTQGASSIGRILTDTHGMTFYTFSGDRPRLSRCAGPCERTWLPVLARGGKPQAAPGVDPAMVGSVQRADGSYQVTYRGQPLYYSIRNKRPGDVAGAGTVAYGGTWAAARPSAGGK